MLRAIFFGASALSLAACATIPPAERPVSVTGSITYRERIALAPTAQVEITLADVSLADAPSTTIAQQAFTADGRQVPFPFRLTVDPRTGQGSLAGKFPVVLYQLRLAALLRCKYSVARIKGGTFIQETKSTWSTGGYINSGDPASRMRHAWNALLAFWRAIHMLALVLFYRRAGA